MTKFDIESKLKSMNQPFIDGFLSYTVSRNLTAVAGQEIKAAASMLPFGKFQADIKSAGSGRVLYVYTETDNAVMSVIFPAAALKSFAGFYKPGDGDTAGDALTRFVNLITGNLPFICSVKAGGELRNAFAVQKPLGNENCDQLLWNLSESSIYSCRAGSAVFYISLNSELKKSIEALLKSDAVFKKTLQEKSAGRKVTGDAFAELNSPEVKLRVKSPLEFIAGSCFLPREANIGKKDVSVVFEGIIAVGDPASRITADMIWYKFQLASGGKNYSIAYSVESGNRDKQTLGFFNSLFTALVKKSASFLRSVAAFDSAGGKLLSSPGKLDDSVILAASVNWENRKIPVRIFVPSFFFAGYLSSLLEDWEVKALQNHNASGLAGLLSVNSSLFSSRIDSFYKGSRQSLSLSMLLSILDLNNAARLVQNYFLAGGSSLDDFQSLFLYRYYPDGSEKAFIGRDALFNKKDYKRYIPQARHSDWDSCSGAAESLEQMLKGNEEVLKGIYRAIQDDKLLMPYKVSYILYNELQKPLDERFKSEINILSSNTPWEELIGQVPKKTGQQAVSAIPSARLAAALASGHPAPGLLSNLVSKKKLAEIQEELRLSIRNYESGLLPAEDVFNALSELQQTLNALAVSEDEMI